MFTTLLIKYGEIGLKGANRYIFERCLQKNLAYALGMPIGAIELRRGRMYLDYSLLRGNKKMIHDLTRVFGVVKYARAYKVTSDIEALREGSIKVFDAAREEKYATFRVTAHRADKRFPIGSMEVQKEIGGAILKKYPCFAVNLSSPDIELHIEIRTEGTFVYADKNEYAGPHGLPVGTGGRGLLLLSGGIDSPVAGWMMMKRGMEIDAVYFHSAPYTSERAKEKAISLACELSTWKQASVHLFIVPFSDVMVEINKKCPEPLWTVLHRRAMVRVAERMTRDAGGVTYDALITGENLGQVASQTIENISAIQRGAHLPILRPLIGFDKQEIVDGAKKIGTFRISTLPYEDCCTVFASKNPATKTNYEEVRAIEQTLGLEDEIDGAIANIKTMEIHSRLAYARRECEDSDS